MTLNRNERLHRCQLPATHFFNVLFFSSCSEALDLDGGLEGLAGLLGASDGLGTHDTSTPAAFALLVLLGVTLLDCGDELGQLGLVLGADFGQSENGSGLEQS